MAIIEEKKNTKNYSKLHNVIMENRANLSVCGVEDVESFDEERVVLYTTMGLMEITGIGLRINHLNVENGEIQLQGTIYSIDYADEEAVKTNFFKKLFK